MSRRDELLPVITPSPLYTVPSSMFVVLPSTSTCLYSELTVAGRILMTSFASEADAISVTSVWFCPMMS